MIPRLHVCPTPSPISRRVRFASLATIALLGACNGGRPQTVPVGRPAEPDGGAVTEEIAPITDGGSNAPVEGTVMAKPGPAVVETPAPAPPATVRVSIRSTPRASVTWGRKSLGTTPLALERPRDSGPMDLVLTASGYLPIHTRAYTFRNDGVSVQLTPIDKKDTLLGARKAPPAPPPGAAPATPGPGSATIPANPAAADGGLPPP
jgi:hypothetical protein